MKNLFRIRYGRNEAFHYYKPGIHLSDEQLTALHHELLEINRAPKARIVHPLLVEGMSVAQLRQYFANAIVSIMVVNGQPGGFEMASLFYRGDKTLLHGGLVVITQNLGNNLMMLLVTGTLLVAYRKEGRIYSSNITSTPSGIEVFARTLSRVWPDPDTTLIRPPRDYKEVAQILYEEYIEKNFLDPHLLHMDYRRFVLSSSSQKMGFVTDFHRVSRPSNFKYLSFCHVWLNYSREEDMIQIGLVDWRCFARALSISLAAKFRALFEKKEKTVVARSLSTIT